MKDLAWPVIFVLTFVTSILRLVCRFAAMLVGLAFLAAGVLLTVTLIGVLVGIPLILAGWEVIRLGLS